MSPAAARTVSSLHGRPAGVVTRVVAGVIDYLLAGVVVLVDTCRSSRCGS
ncbi:hypothetical protein ACHMWU_19440 [Aeromicrobium sp. UC242_57]